MALDMSANLATQLAPTLQLEIRTKWQSRQVTFTDTSHSEGPSQAENFCKLSHMEIENCWQHTCVFQFHRYHAGLPVLAGYSIYFDVLAPFLTSWELALRLVPPFFSHILFHKSPLHPNCGGTPECESHTMCEGN